MFNDVDTDRDGRIGLRDLFDHDPPAAYAPAHPYVEAEQYLVLDSDGDGNVTMAEVDSTLAAFLAEQTRAGVGPLPPAQAAKEGEGRSSLEDVVRCRLPAPSAAARIVRLGAREAGQLSAVALGGQDQETYAVSVDIEPGTEPLYIVATSGGPTLWRLSGATRRVEAFVGSSRARDARSMWPAVGVTGLPRGRFHTVPNACFGEYRRGDHGRPPAPSEVARLVVRRLGRPIDIAFGAYQPQGVRLPSAEPFRLPAEVPDIFRAPRNAQAARGNGATSWSISRPASPARTQGRSSPARCRSPIRSIPTAPAWRSCSSSARWRRSRTGRSISRSADRSASRPD